MDLGLKGKRAIITGAVRHRFRTALLLAKKAVQSPFAVGIKMTSTMQKNS